MVFFAGIFIITVPHRFLPLPNCIYTSGGEYGNCNHQTQHFEEVTHEKDIQRHKLRDPVPLKEIMHHNPTTINWGSTVAKAAARMCHDDVGSCIVLKRNLPVGIVTEQDINCKVVARDSKPSSAM